MHIDNIEKIVRIDLKSCWLRVPKEKMYILFHINDKFGVDKISYTFGDFKFDSEVAITFNFKPYSNIATRRVWRY